MLCKLSFFRDGDALKTFLLLGKKCNLLISAVKGERHFASLRHAIHTFFNVILELSHLPK
jgi:hypothetical protein